MIQKHMPFGYRIENGRAVIDPGNAEIVKRIFHDYRNGISTYRIAKEMTARGILNASHKPSWYHGSVGKILENRKYLGDGFYPPMIDGELFEEVQKRRVEQKTQLGRVIQPNSFAKRHTFTGKLRCGKCGQPYRRYVEHCNQPGAKAIWKCKQYIHGNRVYCRNLFLTDQQVEGAFLEAINRITASPGILERKREKVPGKASKSGRAADERLAGQIRMMLESRTTSAGEIKDLIYERARRQYQQTDIDDYGYQTDKLKLVLAGRGRQSEFVGTLFEQTVRKAVIHEDGKITFQLHNGVEIETYLKK